MKPGIIYFIIAGIVSGTLIGIVQNNIAAGVACSVAISDLPVLFYKRKTRARIKCKK